MEEGEVDLDPGWDTAPLPPIDPSRDLERPVDLALSGVMGVPEFLRPGRAEKKSLTNKKYSRKKILTVYLRSEAPTTPIRFRLAY